MSAPHKSATYKAPNDKHPFQVGQDKAYGAILEHVTKESLIWRKLTIAHVALFLISLILFFAAISQQKVVPVLVNVMPNGESQYLGEVRQTGSLQIPEAAIHFQIRSFVSNIRTISTDYMVVYNNIDDCFYMTTYNYTPIMKKMLLDNSPFDLVGKMRRSVEFESVLLITEHSYTVNWIETVIETSSTTPKKTKYRAVVTVRFVKPTETTIKRNPLGIYIESFDMTEL